MTCLYIEERMEQDKRKYITPREVIEELWEELEADARRTMKETEQSECSKDLYLKIFDIEDQLFEQLKYQHKNLDEVYEKVFDVSYALVRCMDTSWYKYENGDHEEEDDDDDNDNDDDDDEEEDYDEDEDEDIDKFEDGSTNDKIIFYAKKFKYIRREQAYIFDFLESINRRGRNLLKHMNKEMYNMHFGVEFDSRDERFDGDGFEMEKFVRRLEQNISFRDHTKGGYDPSGKNGYIYKSNSDSDEDEDDEYDDDDDDDDNESLTMINISLSP